MPTYNDIGSGYIGNRSGLSSSVKKQLTILEHYLYFLGGCGGGNPFDLDSSTPIHGVVATSALIANPNYSPLESNAEFFTEFGPGDLKIKAIEKNFLWQGNRISYYASPSEDTSSVTPHRGNVQRTTIIVHGTFNNFDTMTVTGGIRSVVDTETISIFMVLIGEFDSLFNCGTNSTFLAAPAIPSVGITANNYGWGSDNTVPYIAPRRLRIKQWGFNVDGKTINLETRRE